MRPVHLALALVFVAVSSCAQDARDQAGASTPPLAPNTSPAPLPMASVATWEPALVTTADLNTRLAAGESLALYDVRSKEAWEKEHIKGAKSLPWADIDKQKHTLPKGTPIVLYCA